MIMKLMNHGKGLILSGNLENTLLTAQGLQDSGCGICISQKFHAM